MAINNASDRPTGASFKPSNTSSPSTKYTKSDDGTTTSPGQISCVGAAVGVLAVDIFNTQIEDTSELVEYPIVVALQINGGTPQVLYDSTERAQKPLPASSGVIENSLGDGSTVVPPLPDPMPLSNNTLPSSFQAEAGRSYYWLYINASDLEVKRLKLINRFPATLSLGQIPWCTVFSSLANPTGGNIEAKIVGEFWEITSTACLSKNGNVVPPDPENPEQGFAPDFALSLSSLYATGSVENVTEGSAYGGTLLPLEGIQTVGDGLILRTMAKLNANTSALSYVEEYDAAHENPTDPVEHGLRISLSDAVLAGDYIEVAFYHAGWSIAIPPEIQWGTPSVTRHLVTAESVMRQELLIPYRDCVLALEEFKANTKYKFVLRAYRGTITQGGVPLDTGAPLEFLPTTNYIVQGQLFLDKNNRAYLSAQYDDTGIIKCYSIGGIGESNVQGGVFNLNAPLTDRYPYYATLCENTNDATWWNVQTQTTNSVGLYFTRYGLGISFSESMSTPVDTRTRFLEVAITDNGQWANVSYVMGTVGSLSVDFLRPLIKDATTQRLRFSSIAEAETADLTTCPTQVIEGVYVQGSEFGNPAGYSGHWAGKRMTSYLALLPPGGYVNDPSEANAYYTPTLYDLVEAKADGRHVLTVSPTNNSLLNTLRKIGVFEPADMTREFIYQYRLLSPDYLLVSAKNSAFLLKLNGIEWIVWVVFANYNTALGKTTYKTIDGVSVPLKRLASVDLTQLIHQFKLLNSITHAILYVDTSPLKRSADASSRPVIEMFSLNLLDRTLNQMIIGE